MPKIASGEQTYLGQALLVSKIQAVVFIRNTQNSPLAETTAFQEALEEARLQKKTFLLIGQLSNDPTQNFLEHILTSDDYENWQIIRLPPVFGPEVPIGSLGILGNYFRNVLNHEPLTIFGEGLNRRPYLFINDAISIINRYLVNSINLKKTTNILPSEILTEVELAYLVKSLTDLPTNISFKERLTKDNNDTILPADDTITAPTPLRESLRLTLKSLKGHATPKVIAKTESAAVTRRLNSLPSNPVAKKNSSKLLFIPKMVVVLGILATVIYSFGWPAVKTAYFGFLGKRALEKTVTNMENLQVEEAKNSATEAETLLSSAVKSAQTLPPLKIFSRAERFLQGGEYLARALKNGLEGVSPFLKGSSSFEEVQTSVPQIKAAYENFLLAKLELSEAGWGDISKLSEIEEALKMAKELAPALPEILGFDRPKSYLLLFQNPMELRATGGFIGSYGKITVEKGQIINLLIDDIYNLDGQLEEKNLAAPVPPEMQVAFPSLKKLYIRDANWWISFPESAKTITSLFKLATGETIDGVVALDLYAVKDLLDVAGPIYLGSYNETITTSNLFERTQANSESNYFDGSPQKKNFLKLLAGKLIEQIQNLPLKQKLKLLPLAKKSLAEKHLLVTITSGEGAGVFAENRWDGRVTVPGDKDFLMVVDTNTGGNKANYFIHRSTGYEVKNTYREGTLEGFLTLTYQNTAPQTSWLGGDYKNFVRILVPKDSFLNEAVVENGDIKSEVIVSNSDTFTSFGFGFTLPPGKEVSFKLHYTLPQKLNLDVKSKDYTLFFIKQPGIEADAFSFKLFTPFGRNLGLPEGYKLEADGVGFSQLIRTDTTLQIPIN